MAASDITQQGPSAASLGALKAVAENRAQQLEQVRRQTDQQLIAAVELARGSGATWDEVEAATGLTRPGILKIQNGLGATTT